MKAVLFLVIFISIQNFASALPAPGKAVGLIGLVEGEVTVDSKPVQKNAEVHEGSVIEVKKGHATVILGKGSVFNIAENSKMVVTQYAVKSETQGESGELDLKFGRTRALILNQGNEKKDIRIKSRAATMGVRGTEIYVDCPKDPAKPIQFFTLEGKAEVKAYPGAAPVPVAQNQGVSTSGVAPASSGNSGGAKGDSKEGARGDGKGGDGKSGAGKTGDSASNGAVAKSGNASTQTAGSNASAPANSTAAAGSAGAPPPQAPPPPGGGAGGPPEVSLSSVTIAEVKAAIASSGLDPAPASAGLPSAGGPPPNRAAPAGLADSTTIAPIPPPPLDPVLDGSSSLSIKPRFCNATTGVCSN